MPRLLLIDDTGDCTWEWDMDEFDLSKYRDVLTFLNDLRYRLRNSGILDQVQIEIYEQVTGGESGH